MSDTDTIAFIRDKFKSLDDSMDRRFEEVKDMFDDHAKTDAMITEKMDTRVKTLEDYRLITKGKIIAYSSVGGGVAAVIGLIVEAVIYR